MRKVVIVIEGSRVGAEFASKAAELANVTDVSYRTRKDNSVMLTGYAPEGDHRARNRWVKQCRRIGLTVLPAPWEARRVEPKREEANEAIRRIADAAR